MRLLFPLFKTKSHIGLDIQAETLRLIQLKQKRAIFIEQAASLDLPEGAIVEGSICNERVILEILKKLIQMTGTQNCLISIALPKKVVMIKQIQLPAILQAEECELEIGEKLFQYFPGNKDSLYFDFHLLEKNHDQQTVLLSAARQDQVNHYVHLINQSGWIVNAVDVDFCAETRAKEFLASREFPEKYTNDMLVSFGLALRDLR